MTVFSGENCENLKCVDANIASAAARVANDASTVEWKTTVIFSVFGALGESGEFGLTVEEVAVPANDVCVQPLQLDLLETTEVAGSTTSTSHDNLHRVLAVTLR
jgi:hypothetical protein